ncbi:MAG: hypothetical protein ABI175_27135 [Polyangiales bacterium]
MLTRSFLRALALLLLAGAACHAEPDDNVTGQKTAPRKATPPPPPCDNASDPVLASPFVDQFERADLGEAEYRSTSYGAYFVKAGRLCTSKPKNHPLWLRRKLPLNVRVEFEALPQSAGADIKAEIFGDGCAFDPDGRDYMATAYVGVLGAHGNTEHWLARMNEHGGDLKKTVLTNGASPSNSRLVINTTYKVELARTDGRTLTMKVNGELVHAFEDSAPLLGSGHDHFGFNGWDAPVCFDKLTVTPL